MKKLLSGALALGLLAGTAGLASAEGGKKQNKGVKLSLGAGMNFSKQGSAFMLRPQLGVYFPYGNLNFTADVYPAAGDNNTAVQPEVSLGINLYGSKGFFPYDSSGFSVGPVIGAKGLVLGDYSGSPICPDPQFTFGVQASLEGVVSGEVSTSFSASGFQGVTLSARTN